MTRIEGAEGILKDLFNSKIPPGIRKNKLINLFKTGANVAAHDHRVRLPKKKLRQGAASEYKMKKRKPNTMKRKRGFAMVSGVNSRLFHVWGGETQEALHRFGKIRSVGAQSGIVTRITYTVPFYILRNRHNVPMFDELTRVSRPDAERWADISFGIVADGL
jgi:hypothetical protein